MAVSDYNKDSKYSNNSEVVNISISDCSLNLGSSDQIGVLLSANDKAKYGSSLVSSPCGDSLFASDKNSEYDSSSNVFISLSNSSKSSENSDSVILAYFIMSDLLLSNSSNIYSGENKLHPLFSNSFTTLLLADDLLKNEKIIEASTISSSGILDINIFKGNYLIDSYNPCLLATLLFNSSASLNANSSVISLFFNISSNLSNLLFLSSLSSSSCLASSEQFNQANLAISDFNLSSTANVIDAIYILPLDLSSSNFLSSSSFLIIIPRTNAAGFISGNAFLNLAINSSGTDTVILGILNSPSFYINKSNYFNVYKPFANPASTPLAPRLTQDNDYFFFDEIVSIKYIGEERVYDLAIEGTHNFIANDIVAYNTYIYGNTFIDGSTFFVDTANDRVGIGTTSPIVNLDIIGNIRVNSTSIPTCNSTYEAVIAYNFTSHKHICKKSWTFFELNLRPGILLKTAK